jgi:hypothetical protein
MTEVGDGHREEGHRDALPRGEQHVELAPRRKWRDPLGEFDELVGGVAHRRDDDDHMVTRALGVDDALGYALDAVSVGDRRAAVLLHDQTHAAPPDGTTPQASLGEHGQLEALRPARETSRVPPRGLPYQRQIRAERPGVAG